MLKRYLRRYAYRAEASGPYNRHASFKTRCPHASRASRNLLLFRGTKPYRML